MGFSPVPVDQQRRRFHFDGRSIDTDTAHFLPADRLAPVQARAYFPDFREVVRMVELYTDPPDQVFGILHAEHVGGSRVGENDDAVDMHADCVGRRIDQPLVSGLAFFQAAHRFALFGDIAGDMQVCEGAAPVDRNRCRFDRNDSAVETDTRRFPPVGEFSAGEQIPPRLNVFAFFRRREICGEADQVVGRCRAEKLGLRLVSIDDISVAVHPDAVRHDIKQGHIALFAVPECALHPFPVGQIDNADNCRFLAVPGER